jgi:hypothetical protein
MEKEFIPYEQALALKELGFDEPCILLYRGLDTQPVCQMGYHFKTEKNSDYSDETNYWITVPTFSQAFKWFREKYGLYYYITPEFYINGINFNWQVLWYLPKEEWTDHNISGGTFMYGDNGEYPTQESAEQACLDKLIEIVKNTQS